MVDTLLQYRSFQQKDWRIPIDIHFSYFALCVRRIQLLRDHHVIGTIGVLADTGNRV
jgi:hypothetical protein